jgi:hypothetical protein
MIKPRSDEIPSQGWHNTTYQGICEGIKRGLKGETIHFLYKKIAAAIPTPAKRHEVPYTETANDAWASAATHLARKIIPYLYL